MPGFDEILGQDSIKAYMKKALERQQVSHAYIISGEEGMGKRMLANAFAMALLCDEGGTSPCGKCHSCIQFATGNHPDISWVTHEKASIGVDEVRAQLVEPMLIKPYHSRFKVYIVDEAELLTVQAQNALLKTIEEPPEYGVVMLLSANPDIFLQTIRSRCTMLKMVPLPDEQIRQYLLKQGAPSAQAEICAAFARGNLGKAIGLSKSEEFAHMRELLVGMLAKVRKMELSEMMEFIRQLKEDGLDNAGTLDFCELWYRDILYRMATGDSNRLIFKSEKDVIEKLAREGDYRKLQQVVDAIAQAKVRLNANVNFETTMELVLLRMKA